MKYGRRAGGSSVTSFSNLSNRFDEGSTLLQIEHAFVLRSEADHH